MYSDVSRFLKTVFQLPLRSGFAKNTGFYRLGETIGAFKPEENRRRSSVAYPPGSGGSDHDRQFC